MSNRNRSILAFCVISLFGLSSCSNQPSESAGKKILGDRIAAQSSGNIQLTSFKKTNGELNGNRYGMEFEAVIEFLHNGTWFGGDATATSVAFGFSPAYMDPGSAGGFANMVMGGKLVQQGTHTTIRSILRFQKTERGWRGEDDLVY